MSATLHIRRPEAEALNQEIDFLASRVNECYDHLTPAAKLVALELARSLHRLKMRLVQPCALPSRPAYRQFVHCAANKAYESPS